MPCTLPDSEVAGVFMSPCASIQSRPSGSFLACVAQSAAAATEPAADCDRRRARAEARPPRATPARSDRASGRPSAISRMYFLSLVALLPRFGNGRRQVAFVDDREPSAPDARRGPRCGTRRPHVHAAPPAAEVQRHADHMDGRSSHFVTGLQRDRNAFVRGLDDSRQKRGTFEWRRGSRASPPAC